MHNDIRVCVAEAEGSGQEILSAEAIDFTASLDREFAAERSRILQAREIRAAALLDGADLDFPAATAAVRNDPLWRVPPPPRDLRNRRVEIAWPAENRKTAINALNSGAQIWVADLEDATSPSWRNIVASQVNLRDAVDGGISYLSPAGRRYRLADKSATIVVRPRGWHLPEAHMIVDGRPAAAALVDFGLYFFHCARAQLERGSGPYFYLPKIESAGEAALWNDVFEFAQDALGIPRGSVRAPVLIETVPAAVEMPEILRALGPHAAGLTAGRLDYLFSLVREFRTRPGFVLPDRAGLTMTVPFLRQYTRLLIDTCHRRGTHAIGGVATQIPDRNDPVARVRALSAVRADKERESAEGFDGSRVVHPDLVRICRAAFGHGTAKLAAGPAAEVPAASLLDVGELGGHITEAGVRSNVRVSVRYLQGWLEGRGSVAIRGLMEVVATAEIARSQLWQWIRHGARMGDGGVVTQELVTAMMTAELSALEAEGVPPHRLAQTRELFEDIALRPDFPRFLTIPGYARLTAGDCLSAPS